MMNVAAMEIRLGHDPELRYTKSGTAVTNFSGANNRRYNGNEYTNWPRFVCWGKLAEIVVQYLKKGSHANL
ncbi:single-stranded DNA-binding protein, partial [bacterium]|nr:single-stranded DNA-binding protein [bacterium]